jgi:hypothetical protein
MLICYHFKHNKIHETYAGTNVMKVPILVSGKFFLKFIFTKGKAVTSINTILKEIIFCCGIVVKSENKGSQLRRGTIISDKKYPTSIFFKSILTQNKKSRSFE